LVRLVCRPFAFSLHGSCQRQLIFRVLISNGFFGVMPRRRRIPELSVGLAFGFPRRRRATQKAKNRQLRRFSFLGFISG
jgi:hypothetical protein